MPALTESTNGCRVMFLPQTVLKEGDDSNEGQSKIIELKHPKTGEAAQYLINERTKDLFEIMSFTEEHRSWFIGNRVVEDGSLLLSTRIDPTFLILPYLISAEKNVPLEDLLEDPEYKHNLFLSELSDGLKNVANQLGTTDLNVWKYDEDKCLSWLQRRVEAVQKVLASQEIDVSGGASSLTYKAGGQAGPKPVEFTRYSLGIISEYLPKDLAAKLKERLNLPDADKSSAKRQSEGGGGPPAKKSKQLKQEPTEDYTIGQKKGYVKDPELNAKQKALAKSAEGTKSIMSFFKKK